MRTRWMFVLGVAGLLAGCATSRTAVIPDAIRNPPPGDLQLVEAQKDIQAHRGAPVRWGGTVVSVRPGENESWVEIVHRNLDWHGRPLPGTGSDGRFFTVVPERVSQDLRGHDVTVAGTLGGHTDVGADEHQPMIPVVDAGVLFVWRPVEPAHVHYHEPYILFSYRWGYPYWYPRPYVYYVPSRVVVVRRPAVLIRDHRRR